VDFWIVAPCSVVAGYRRFGGPCCMKIEAANVGILPQHYTTQQPRKTQILSSPPRKRRQSHRWMDLLSSWYRTRHSDIT